MNISNFDENGNYQAYTYDRPNIQQIKPLEVQGTEKKEEKKEEGGLLGVIGKIAGSMVNK